MFGWKKWNGGLLCLSNFDGRTHVLMAIEYRRARKLTDLERLEASHYNPSNPNLVLQLNVPGGRSEKNETVLETIVREFWEETGRIIDTEALSTCLLHRGKLFLCERSRYILCLAHNVVPPTIVEKFDEKVSAGYPDECALKLVWIPWKQLKSNSPVLQIGEMRLPLSRLTKMTLILDKRIRNYLNQMSAT